jgi:hypothetical protein
MKNRRRLHILNPETTTVGATTKMATMMASRVT